MAASERVSGYQCQFISEVSDELLCGICRLVARESHSTNCCGEHFCKNCITQVLDASKPCPSCSEAEFAIFPDLRDQKKILALQVCCTMKDRGCEWVGKLEDLQAHLLVDTNDCQYVDIQCPDKCGESVPRHQLTSHLADSCLNRDYFCKYCNFSDTYHVVCYDHWPKCLHYPVQCPNACSVGAVERGDLEDHIKVCLLQEVLCELSYAGCKETFLRKDQGRHMEENTQKHLLLMSAMTQRMNREFEQKLQEQREEKEREIAEVKQELREKDDQMQALEKKREQEMKALRGNSDRAMKVLKEEKDKQMEELRVEVASLTHKKQSIHSQRIPKWCTPPVCFTMNNFNKLKTDSRNWTSPDLYTHKGGYKISFIVRPNMKYFTDTTYVIVHLYTKPGEFDDQLKWPVTATITLQLLNQHRDQDHITKTTRECKWSRPARPTSVTGWYAQIAHSTLEWNCRKRTQYLKNDCLVFRLTKVELKC